MEWEKIARELIFILYTYIVGFLFQPSSGGEVKQSKTLYEYILNLIYMRLNK